MEAVGRRWRCVAAVGAIALAALVGPSAAGATGLEVMPLAQVQPGARCSARSVLHGTTISSFPVDVVDVVSGTTSGEGPRILLRVGDPAPGATGIGPGFSGSPVLCRDGAGVERVIGAISEGVGDAGNHLALATPIEAILSEPLTPSDRARASGARVAARPLYAPLSLAGAPAWLGRLARAGAERAGRTLYTAPAAPQGASAPAQLEPGSAMAVGLATGDVQAGAIGTVAYRDGDVVWAFGHPLDGAGRRSLLLQDAYVFGVVDEPGFLDGSFKLAAPTQSVGLLSDDAANAVVGRLGALPRTVPLTVAAHDDDRGRATVLHVQAADESALGDPAGSSPLRLATDVALPEAADSALDGAPTRQTARMCLTIALRGRRTKLGFCNRYLVNPTPDSDGSGEGIAQLVTEDADQAIALLDGNSFAALPVAQVRVSLRAHRGLDQSLLMDARGPRRVHPGQRVHLRLTLRRYRGRTYHTRIAVRVPRDVGAGRRILLLRGTPTDTSGSGAGLEKLFADLFGGGAGDDGAASLPELAARIADISRYDGVTGAWLRPGRHRHLLDVRPVYRSAKTRISGSAIVAVRVTRRR